MPLEEKQVLVIDDAASIRTFLRISLQAHGAFFYEAASADAGLKRCEEVKPDLVVLDLGLPDKYGLDILPEIKRPNINGRIAKVIILSVRKDLATKDQAFRLGADAYVTKPFLMDDLLEVIEHHIG